MNSLLHFFFRKDFDVVAEFISKSSVFSHVFKLPRSNSNAKFTSSFPVTFDSVALYSLFNLVKIFSTQSLNDAHFVGEAVHAISKSVGE